jgi:hypothetical protein
MDSITDSINKMKINNDIDMECYENNCMFGINEPIIIEIQLVDTGEKYYIVEPDHPIDSYNYINVNLVNFDYDQYSNILIIKYKNCHTLNFTISDHELECLEYLCNYYCY